MTKQQAVEKILSLAEAWTGRRNQVVDVYNSYQPHPRGYAVTYNDALCATYVSALFIALGWTKIVPPECGAMQLGRNMDALGRYAHREDHTPAPGDLIFFDWQGDAWVDHVGLVIGVDGDTVTYSHIPAYGVTVGTVSAREAAIRGYGFPDYAAAGRNGPDPEPESFRPGDLVRIRDRARWYTGTGIPDFVRERAWYVIEVSGDRAVLGMDEEKRFNIQSPIRTGDLEPANGPVPTEPETVEVTVTLQKDTWERLRRSGKSVQQLLEEVLG